MFFKQARGHHFQPYQPCRMLTAGIGRRWWRLLSSLAGSQNPWLAVRVHLSLELRRCGSRLTPRYVVRIYVWYILLLSTS